MKDFQSDEEMKALDGQLKTLMPSSHCWSADESPAAPAAATAA